MKTSNKILFGLLGLVVIGILSSAMYIRSIVANMETLEGSGNVHTEERDIASFNEVYLRGSYDVLLRPGTESLQIVADDNLLSSISSETSNDKLTISTLKTARLQPTEKIQVIIGYDDISAINVSGSCNISSEGVIKGESLKLSNSGFADFKFPIDVNELELKIAGSGKSTLTGRADEAEYKISGSGKIRNAEVNSNTVAVSISGSGSAHVNAEETLGVSISGSGSVKYSGKPQLSQSISGSGSIKTLD